MKQFITISILIHIILLLLMWNITPRIDPTDISKNEELPIEIILNSNEPKQIVDIPKPENEEKPDQSKLLGLYNSKAEQEQVTPPSEPMPAKPAPSPKKEPISSEAKEKDESKMKEKNSEEGVGSKVSQKKKTIEEPPLSEASQNGWDVGVPSDFLPDYKIGGKTYLNVERYPQISYFVRLKKIFRTTWNPRPALLPVVNRITKGDISVVVGIEVDAKGGLSKLFVIQSSGFDAYDREALRTIKDSSPFSAPPAAFMKESILHMAWTFTVML